MGFRFGLGGGISMGSELVLLLLESRTTYHKEKNRQVRMADQHGYTNLSTKDAHIGFHKI